MTYLSPTRSPRQPLFTAALLTGFALSGPMPATAQDLLTFPARASNLAIGDYWSIDEFDEADNTTVLDLNVRRWDGNSWETGKPDSIKNSDNFDWNVPIYAPANGVIVSCWQNSLDNPNTNTKLSGIGSTIFGGGNHVVILTDDDMAISLNHFRQGTIDDGLCPSNDDGVVNVPTMDKIGDFRAAAFIQDTDRPRVTEGQLIGRVGNSGNSGGPHLHMSMQPVDTAASTANEIFLERFVPIRIRQGWAHKFIRDEKDSPGNWFRFRGSELSANHEPKFKLIHASPYLRRSTASGGGGIRPELDVAYLNNTRTVTATIGASDGAAKLIIWDLVGLDGFNRRGSIELGAAKDVRLGLTSSSSFLAAVRQQDDVLKMIAFHVTPTGQILRRGEFRAGEISALDMATTLGSSKRAVTAVRASDGRLRLISWRIGIENGAEVVDRVGTQIGPEVSDVAISNAGNFSGVLTALRVNGSLRVVPWRMEDGGATFVQGDAGTAGAVGSQLDVARLQAGVAAAMRDSNGALRIITWETSTDGDILGGRKGTLTAHGVLEHRLLQSPSAGSNLTSVMRGSDGDLYLIGWAVDADGGDLRRLGTSRAGGIGGLAAASAIRSFSGSDPREYLLTAVQTGQGELRLISWDTNLENP